MVLLHEWCAFGRVFMGRWNLLCPHSLLRGSFEDLVLVDGRLRWGRLENLFKEGSKSQDYDPQQVCCLWAT